MQSNIKDRKTYRLKLNKDFLTIFYLRIVLLTLTSFFIAQNTIGYLRIMSLIPYQVSHILNWLYLAFIVITLFTRVVLLVLGKLGFQSWETTLTCILMGWITVLHYIWYPHILEFANIKDFLGMVTSTVVYSWFLFIAGEALGLMLQSQHIDFLKWFKVLYILVVATIIFGIFLGYTLYGQIFFLTYNPQNRGSYHYQIIGDSLAILGIFMLGYNTKSNSSSLLLSFYIFTSVVTLFSKSRGSFFGFVLAGLSMFLVISRTKRKITLKRIVRTMVILTTLVAVIVFLGLSFSSFEEIMSEINNLAEPTIARITMLLQGEDESAQQRLEQFRFGTKWIRENWFYGYLMVEIKDLGKGNYIHNILSYLVSYGIGPFLLLIWILLKVGLKVYHEAIHRGRDEKALAGLGIYVFILFQILFVRSYVWSYLWLGIGFLTSVPSGGKASNLSKLEISKSFKNSEQ